MRAPKLLFKLSMCRTHLTSWRKSLLATGVPTIGCQQAFVSTCPTLSAVIVKTNVKTSYTPLWCWNNGLATPLLLSSQQIHEKPPACGICRFGTKYPLATNKSDAKSAAVGDIDLFGRDSKLSLFAKFKLMYKKYWYVLIPVHVVTSIGWMASFYYLSTSGVDLAVVMSYLHISESITERVQNSSLGHWAVAYLCFKVATPFRYAVTLGCTTAAIRYFVQRGQIKPIPSKKEIMRIYEEKLAQKSMNKDRKHVNICKTKVCKKPVDDDGCPTKK